MALPTNVGTGTVVWNSMDGAGVTMTGSVTFTPSPKRLMDTVATPSPVTIFPKAVTTTLVAGALSQVLIATDDADLNPLGWTWTATFNLTGVTADPITFALPQGTTVDLTTVTPVGSSGGTLITAGAPGVGIPAGGATGSMLSKNSGTDYDTGWTASSTVGRAVLAAVDKPAARAAAGLVTTTPGAGEVQLVDPSAIQVSEWMPSDMGWLAWTADPFAISTASNWTSGTLQCWGLIARQALTLNTVTVSVGAAVATPTTGQNLVGIYQGGSRLAQSADQSASGFASTGRKDIALTSAASVTAGLFYVVVLSVATTTPQFHTGGSAGAMNSSSVVRFGTANTGQTSLPSTLGTITGATPNQRAFWAAVS